MRTVRNAEGRIVELRRLLPSRPGMYRAVAALFLVAIHVLPAVALFSGTALRDWLMFLLMVPVLAFAVIAGLHRYFAHRSYETSRAFQFLMGLGACLAFTDPIGFAGKHRIHHRYSDTDADVHSPEEGFWYCWFGSMIDEGYRDDAILAQARDLAVIPELRWLHRFVWVPGIVFGTAVYAVGGFSLFAIGYLAAIAVIMNMSSAVNYACHRWGSRPYDTPDLSRNNALVALLTFGEGWHNNHHHFPGTARAGFHWWQFDPAYWAIRALGALGIVWDIREVPDRVREAAARRQPAGLADA